MADIDSLREPIIRTQASRRTRNRDSLFLSATIRREADPDKDLISVRVRNLSAVGMMADYEQVAVSGEPVVVTMRGIGSIAGKVAWVRKNRIGIVFDREIDPKLVRKPIKAAPPRQPARPLRPV